MLTDMTRIVTCHFSENNTLLLLLLLLHIPGHVGIDAHRKTKHYTRHGTCHCWGSLYAMPQKSTSRSATRSTTCLACGSSSGVKASASSAWKRSCFTYSPNAGLPHLQQQQQFGKQAAAQAAQLDASQSARFPHLQQQQQQQQQRDER
jgi:hypothetical protein